MTLPNPNDEAPAGSAEEARRDAEQYASDAAEALEDGTSVADALRANTQAQLAVAARVAQLCATLEALGATAVELVPSSPGAMLGKLLGR